MNNKIDFYGEKLNVYKANLHMHSTASDGKFPLQTMVDLYREEGYDILAATDHRTTNRIGEIASGDLLLISGMEYHPFGPRGLLLHLLALNIPEDFADPSQMPYQEAIDLVRESGGETVLAHPYWSGFNCVDLMQIKNIIAIEVYNTATRNIGKAYNMQVWDDILQLGYHLPAIAVDDTHYVHDFFQGWTMICTKEKTAAAVLEAVKNGFFYASQGPVIHKINFEKNVFAIECSPCEEIIIMGNCHFGRCGTMPGFNAADIQELKQRKSREMTAFEVEIPLDSGFTYIRCQLRDKNGRYAWSSPLKIPARTS
ncbi:MAG: CehA/McbA family metallohydrolase [Victivallaceae bacterium]|nr:CehA/McbA family metallohydrolase [Victivallaceae bacterium]